MDPNPTVMEFDNESEAYDWALQEVESRLDHIIQHSPYSMSEDDVKHALENEMCLVRIEAV
tara:strand:- start:51 stop:233 length:183 start_codon:yes stop_codon:yes gene_type:complete